MHYYKLTGKPSNYQQSKSDFSAANPVDKSKTVQSIISKNIGKCIFLAAV